VTVDDGHGGVVSDEFDLVVSNQVLPPDTGTPPPPPPPPPSGVEPPGPEPETTEPVDPGTAGEGTPEETTELSKPGGGEVAAPDPETTDTAQPVESTPVDQEVTAPPAQEPAEVQDKDPGSNVAADGKSAAEIRALIQADGFAKALNEQRDVIQENAILEQKIVGSAMTVTTGLSVGYVIWLIRGGVLLSSMLASLPAWRMIDPLPVLAFTGKRKKGGEDKDDESLESIVSKGSKVTDLEYKPAEESSHGDSVDNGKG